MQEFSLERISEQIHYGKTKAYFQEVLSSYNNGNYRSSVVMLWSVAICDIVYKLQSLIDLYDDSAAKEILREVTAIQNEDYKSSAWEIKLLDDVHEKTFLLDSSEYENLRYLQKQRHLSAHPVLNSERELHSPNKETVRSPKKHFGRVACKAAVLYPADNERTTGGPFGVSRCSK